MASDPLQALREAVESFDVTDFLEGFCSHRDTERLLDAALKLVAASPVETGWNYDMEAAPKDDTVEASVWRGDSPEVLVVWWYDEAWEGPGWYTFFGSQRRVAPYAWRPRLESIPPSPAPYPVTQEGADRG